MATLASIRAALLAQENKTSARSSGSNDNSLFPFWNIPDDQTAVIRFLPDKDETNDFFWRERQMIKIPFSGVKGGDENKPVTVQVPCVEMWGDTCPIHAEIRPWFKDPSLEDLARKYWKKRSFIFQGFVVTNPLAEDELPENPIRRFTINAGIVNIIKTALMDPDIEELPTDYDQGLDFRLTKTKNGKYADYNTSVWARRERSLSQEERDAIAKYDLFDLNDFMPKRPNEDEMAAIVEMFEASVDGQLYDPEKWAQYYRPFGVDRPQTTGTPKPEPTHRTVEANSEDKTSDIPFDVDEAEEAAPIKTEAASGEARPSAKDILESIRNRGA